MLSNDTTLSRRSVLAFGGAALLAAFVPARGAFALTTAEATSLVQKIVDETLAVANSTESEARAIAAFEGIIAKYGDMGVIARSALGRPWQAASSSQQSAFTKAFQGYIARKYGSEFREYRGASMDVTGATDRGDKGVVVNSVVKVPGSAPILVDWQVSDRSGAPKMFNLFIEGISMLSTERSEVAAIMESNRNDLDKTIADLNTRG